MIELKIFRFIFVINILIFTLLGQTYCQDLKWNKGKEYDTHIENIGEIQKIFLTEDELSYFTYSKNGILSKWDVSSGKLLYSKELKYGDPNSFDITKDGKYLIYHKLELNSNIDYQKLEVKINFKKFDLLNNKLLKDTNLIILKNVIKVSDNRIVNPDFKSEIYLNNNSIYLSFVYKYNNDYPQHNPYIIEDLHFNSGFACQFAFETCAYIKEIYDNSYTKSLIFSNKSDSISFSKYNLYSEFYQITGDCNYTYNYYFKTECNIFNKSLISATGTLSKMSCELAQLSNDELLIPCYFKNIDSIFLINTQNMSIVKSLFLYDLNPNSEARIENFKNSSIFSKNDNYFINVSSLFKPNSNEILENIFNFINVKSNDSIKPINILGDIKEWKLSASKNYNFFITGSKDGNVRIFYLDYLSKGLSSLFYANKRTTFIDLPIKFYDNSKGNPYYWKWDFGDSTFSNEINPIHFYKKSGIYTIKLITYNGSVYDTIVKQNYIEIRLPLISSFEVTKNSGYLPFATQFINKSLGEIKAFNWDFGDSTFNNEQNPSHIYTKAGDYSVSLIIFDGFNYNTLSKKNYIHVNENTAVDDNFVVETPPFSPNPVKDNLFIKATEFNIDDKIQILDLKGRKLIETELKEIIEVSSLSKGIYFLKIGEKQWKFVKE